MTISFGSGQTSGVPLLVTAITQAGAQTLHTAVAGAATPNRIRLFALNEDALPHLVSVEIEVGGNTRVLNYNLGIGSGLQALTSDEDHEIVLNGAATLKVWCDAASKVSVTASVNDQADASAASSQTIASGLVAAVRNDGRYAVNAQGGVGQAVEENAQIIIAQAGILKNLIAYPDAPVAALANCTIVVRVNGVGTALALAFDNASGTTSQVDTESVAVAVGDKVCFLINCDDGADPVANFHASVEYIAG